jgi:hypothetical protein
MGTEPSCGEQVPEGRDKWVHRRWVHKGHCGRWGLEAGHLDGTWKTTLGSWNFRLQVEDRRISSVPCWLRYSKYSQIYKRPCWQVFGILVTQHQPPSNGSLGNSGASEQLLLSLASTSLAGLGISKLLLHPDYHSVISPWAEDKMATKCQSLGP